MVLLELREQEKHPLPDKSRSIKPFPGDRWRPDVIVGDNAIAVSPQALIGSDIWIDPLFFNGFFLSDALVKALKKAKCTSGFALKKCQVVGTENACDG
jgi:hypothetical protein